MSKSTHQLTRTVALAALIGSGGACAESGQHTPTEATGGDPVEAEIANLGTPITGCDGSGYVIATKILTLNLTDVPLVLSATGGVFSANGIKCVSPAVISNNVTTTPSKPLKLTDITHINLVGDAHDNKVILDFLPGTFGTSVLAAAGGIDVKFNQPLVSNVPTGTGNDSLMIRAGATPDTYKFGASITAGKATNVYAELTGDKAADVNVALGDGTLTLVASMGAGNDVVTASPVVASVSPAVVADIATFSGAMINVVPLPAGLGIKAYGGPGDDKFTGGKGDDEFYGGDGNDSFKALATTDGADVYSGDVGDDTVDYSDRTNPLRIDIGPATASMESGTDLSDPSLYGATGSLNGTVLAFTVDGRHVSVTLTAPTKPQDIIDAINTAVRAAGASGGTGVYAGLTAKNHLVLHSVAAPGAVKPSVRFDTDTGIATGTAADAILGFTTPTTALAVQGSTGGAGTLLSAVAGGSSTLTGTRLVMLVNDVYTVVNFIAADTDTAQHILDAINTQLNTQLSTTAVVYASVATSAPVSPATTPLVGALVITADSVQVLPGAVAYDGSNNTALKVLGFTTKLEGSVDLTATANAGLYTAGSTAGTLDSKVLPLLIDGARVDVPLGSPTQASDLITTINTVANTALGTSGVTYASMTFHTHHLVVMSNTDVPGASATVNPTATGTAVAAPANGYTGAETKLGFTAQQVGYKLVGADLSLSAALTGLTTQRLVLLVNGDYVVADFATVTDAASVVTIINTAAGSSIASQNGTTNRLELASSKLIRVLPYTTTYTAGTALTSSVLGLTTALVKSDAFDADDGEAGEQDDVRYSTENINGGSGDDFIMGNDAKNTIKGNGGNDVISGGANKVCTTVAADALVGGLGDDTFLMPAANCKAVLTGGDGNNVADFSGRSVDLKLSNNGTADDGAAAVPAVVGPPAVAAIDAEGANISTDIAKVIGGFGNDTITGSAMDDIIVGGPGADVLVGGAGNDTVDYSSSPASVSVTLCFKTPPAMPSTMAWATLCGTADDGMTGEGDQVDQFEHVIGSAFADTISGSVDPMAPGLVLEGGAGNDTITGGPGDDYLWGDDGDDNLNGAAGNDELHGDAGNNVLDGGDGDGDICFGQGDTVTPVNCEIES